MTDVLSAAEPTWTDDALRMLARAGRVLGASLDPAETLDALVQLLVPAVADAAIIRLGRLAEGQVDAESLRALPQLEADLRAYIAEYPATDPGASLMAQAAARRCTTIRRNVDAAWCRSVTRSPDQASALAALGLTSVVVVPLMVGDRVLGALSLMIGGGPGRTVSEAAVLLAEELAARAAVAVDHARLFDAERAARGRLELLQALSGKLAQAESAQAVAAILLREGRTALGASMGVVSVPSADGLRLDVLATAGYAAGVMDRWTSMELDPSVPMADAFIRREPIWLGDTAQRAAQYPAFSSFQSEAGYVAGASIPLVAHGAALGVLGLAFPQEHRFDEAERTLVLSVAQQCAIALARVAAMRALRGSEARFRSLFELDLVGVFFWSVDGRVLDANDSFIRMLGYARDEFAMGSARWSELTPPEWSETDARAYEQMVRTGKASPYRKEFFRKDGSRLPVLMGGGLLDGVLGHGAAFILDLSDALEGEKVRRQWADVFEHTSHAVGVTDARTDRILMVNPAYARVFGFEASELAGQPVSILYTDDDPGALGRNVQRIEAHGQVHFEAVYRRKDGTRFPAAVDATLVRDASGRSLYRIVNVEDLTERQRFEEELRQAQKMEAIGRLAGGVAHEINNALQGVLGFTAFALRALPEENPARPDVEMAAQSGERVRDIAQQLLAFSRRQRLQAQPLDLGNLLADFAPMLRQALGPSRELVITTDAVPPVFADRGQLEQVLLNLALNARDATASGGRVEMVVDELDVTSEVLQTDAELRASQVMPGRYARLVVRDSGHGMSEATRSRIFEPFFTTKGAGEGTGLGLAVVHGIVEQSAGRIWCVSAPAKGTSFTLVFPEATSTQLAAPGHPGTGDAPRRGAERVLVVDDEPHVRAFIRRELEGMGYHVREAADGQAALAWIEAVDSGVHAPVDLVITDLIMPRMGGRELGAEIADRWDDVPVLYISGYSGDEVERRGWLPEEASFLQKPFAGEQLAHRVRLLLDVKT